MSRYKAYSEYRDSGLSWLGPMPIHWKLVKSKYLFQRVQREVRPEDGVVTAFRDGQVTLRTNRRVEGFTESIKEIGYQGVRVGDLLVHAMDGFAGAIGVSDSDGKCSPVCSVCVPANVSHTHVRYYGYLVRQLAVTDFITSLAKGIRERSTEFRYSEFSALELALPSILEQQKIANFLDHETAKIDTLIAKQQELIKLLKEKRQAVISHAVTKGLNPNAPMRDSGVEWLGEVPAHWNVSQVKYLCYVNDGNHGEEYPKESDYVDELDGVPFIRGGNMNNFTIANTDMLFISKKKNESMRKGRLQAGDILFMNRGEIGKLALIPVSYAGSNLNSQIAYLRCISEKISNKYLLYYLASTYIENFLLSMKMGSVLTQFPIGDLLELKVLLPSLGEQTEVVTRLDRELFKIELLVIKAEKIIEITKERRTALISAAVTGKIDVRDWQPPSDTAIAA